MNNYWLCTEKKNGECIEDDSRGTLDKKGTLKLTFKMTWLTKRGYLLRLMQQQKQQQQKKNFKMKIGSMIIANEFLIDSWSGILFSWVNFLLLNLLRSKFLSGRTIWFASDCFCSKKDLLWIPINLLVEIKIFCYDPNFR